MCVFRSVIACVTFRHHEKTLHHAEILTYVNVPFELRHFENMFNELNEKREKL